MERMGEGCDCLLWKWWLYTLNVIAGQGFEEEEGKEEEEEDKEEKEEENKEKEEK